MKAANLRSAGPLLLAIVIIALIVTGCKITPPNVVRTTPANQITDVPVSPAVVTIGFDKPMVTESTQNQVTITPAVGTGKPDYSWSTGDRVLVITYPGSFQPNTTYTVKIGGSAKAANNVTLAQPVEFTFTTAAAAAAEQPVQPEQPAPPAQQPTPPTQPAQPTLTFTKDIKPLAEERCDGCHGGMATGKMSIYSDASKYVTPNNPDSSPFYVRPTGKNHVNAWGDRATVVRNWINQGAKE